MYLLHNIGEKVNSNYNTIEEVSSHDNLTFDGIYLNVWEHRAHLVDKNVTLFVMGNFVGKDNSFDVGMPYEKYCDWNQIMDLVNLGAKLGWHTWSHTDLTKLSKDEILKEITPPFPMDELAYPHGKFNDLVIQCAKEVGFKKAWSVTEGDNSDYQLRREYLCLN